MHLSVDHEQETMIILSLKDELAKAIPFRIEYNFEQAYADFRQAHPETDELLSKKWRNAFGLAARAELEEASRIFEGLNQGQNGHAFSALFNGAMCHLLNGRVSDAAICFSKAATLFPLAAYLCRYHRFHVGIDQSGQ